MTGTCLMCGTPVAQGFLCAKCDKSRKPKPRPATSSASGGSSSSPLVTSVAAALIDEFPKAPIVPFPVEATSPAITSLANVLVAAAAAAIVIGADRSVKFVTD